MRRTACTCDSSSALVRSTHARRAYSTEGRLCHASSDRTDQRRGPLVSDACCGSSLSGSLGGHSPWTGETQDAGNQRSKEQWDCLDCFGTEEAVSLPHAPCERRAVRVTFARGFISAAASEARALGQRPASAGSPANSPHLLTAGCWPCGPRPRPTLRSPPSYSTTDLR